MYVIHEVEFFLLMSAKCKNRTTVLLVQRPAPWCPWSSWSTLIHLGPQFPEGGYTKCTKLDQGGPGVDQGHKQDPHAGWWTRSVQDHLGSLKNIFLMWQLYYSHNSIILPSIESWYSIILRI